MLTMFTTTGFVLLSVAFASRLIWLVPSRWGWLFYASNILIETGEKRARIPRRVTETACAIVGGLLFASPGGYWRLISAGSVTVLLLLELHLRSVERQVLTTSHTFWHQGVPGPGGDSLPGPHPELIISLRGPFVARSPSYSVGDLARGRSLHIEILVGNHTIVAAQYPIKVHVRGTSSVSAELSGPGIIPPPAPGGVARVRCLLEAEKLSPAGKVTLTLDSGVQCEEIAIHYHSVFSAEEGGLEEATVTRYPGACRSAFAWRGDMDLYDTATMQSVEGLQGALGLAARYRMPQTVFLSSRLSVDTVEAEEYQKHFGVARGYEQVPRFIDWVRSNVLLAHELRYPIPLDRPYALELGNHGHLHYGTDAAAAEGNGWTRGAGIRAGSYEWVADHADSYGEQRDNAIATGDLFEKLLDFSPRSWAMPDSTRDEQTPRAMEAAGCEVLSDSDAGHRHNVLLQPPPHHPEATTAVELTKRYPGDPQHLLHVGMIRFWMHRGCRLGIPVIFMCHQHMRQYDGWGCTRFTEDVLRYCLTRFNGDLHVNTVYGIGKYWREVLSPQTASVSIDVRDKQAVVSNVGTYHLRDVPVDLTYSRGRKGTVLVDLPPGVTVTIEGDGTVSEGEA